MLSLTDTDASRAGGPPVPRRGAAVPPRRAAAGGARPDPGHGTWEGWPMSIYRVWGWGASDDEAPRSADVREFARGLESVFGFPGQPPEEPAPLRALAEPRVALPSSLAALGSAEPVDRARHGLGRSYRDVVRGLRGAPDHIPDLVVRPGGA